MPHAVQAVDTVCCPGKRRYNLCPNNCLVGLSCFKIKKRVGVVFVKVWKQFMARLPCHESYAGFAAQAGGAYTLNTGGSVTVRSTIRRLREQIEI